MRLVLPEAATAGAGGSALSLSEAHLDCTLEELSMCPRAVLIASIYSDADREARFSQVHDSGKTLDAQKDVQIVKEKK